MALVVPLSKKQMMIQMKWSFYFADCTQRMINIKVIEVLIGHYNAFCDITNVADTFSIYLMQSFHIIPMQFLIVIFIALCYYSITLCKIHSLFSSWSPTLNAGDAKTSSVCNADTHRSKIDNQYFLKDTRRFNFLGIT